MKAPSELTNHFLQRFQELGRFLESTADLTVLTFDTFLPVSEQEISAVEQTLGTKLDEIFLAYFRESNGYELQYTLDAAADLEDYEGGLGAVCIPGLQELFDFPIETYSEPGQRHLETLGGRDEYALRTQMYCFDHYDKWRDESVFYAVYYVVGDNVLLQSDDYEACIGDDHPITVPSYFELCLATAGLVQRRQLLARGCAGNYATVDFARETYAPLYPWSKMITSAQTGDLPPEFRTLTALATENKGRYL